MAGQLLSPNGVRGGVEADAVRHTDARHQALLTSLHQRRQLELRGGCHQSQGEPVALLAASKMELVSVDPGEEGGGYTLLQGAPVQALHL